MIDSADAADAADADAAFFGRFRKLCSSSFDDHLDLLVDVVEEEYRQDSIPHVQGADRRAVLSRSKPAKPESAGNAASNASKLTARPVGSSSVPSQRLSLPTITW